MFDTLIKKGSKALSSEQKTILSAAGVIGGIYAFSAIIGLVKNRLLSSYFGDSTELGLFFAADTIPSLIFSLIVAGSLSAAFIPIFTKLYKKDEDEAWKMASGVMNVTLVLLLIFSILIIIFADFVAGDILARNTSLSESDIKLMANLMRVMMLAQIALIISSILTSILQSFNRFVVSALAPVIYNLGSILFLVLFVDEFGIFAPALGMIFGSILHLLSQIPQAKEVGFNYKFGKGFLNRNVWNVYKLMIPRTIGQAAQKLLIPLYTNLALFISAPSNVVLYFAFAIQSLPVRIFGMSMGQASLPMLSKAYKDDDLNDFKDLLIKTIHETAYFVLPISILFLVLRVPLVRLAVGASKYSWEATIMTSYTLGFFSISLVAQSLVIILAKAFYALNDTVTPLKVGVFTIVVNSIIAIGFVKIADLGVWSLGFAYAIAAFIECLLLVIYMYHKVHGFNIEKIIIPLNKMLIATYLMGIALYIPLKLLDQLIFDTTKTIWLLVLTGIVSLIGGFAYLLLSKMLNIKELNVILFGLNAVTPLSIRRFFRKVADDFGV